MMSVIDPYMNARVSFRYAMAMFPISLAFYGCDVTSWWFLIDSSLINGYMGWYAFQFWRGSTDARARSLFFSSLVHLPIFLILLMLHKSKETKETKESKINV
jgi:protoheme IX farnesyltransferase